MITVLPYLLLFFLFFVFANFDIWKLKLNNRSYKGAYWFLLTTLILFAGFRWFNVPLEQGERFIIFDYSAYEYAYNNPVPLDNFFAHFISSNNYIRNMDIGYVWVSSFFSIYLIDNPNLFFLIISLFTIIVFAKGLKRNNINNAIFLILFIFLTRLYFQYNFIMMRQAIAMAISWWAIQYIVDRKLWKFFVCCMFAGVFHFTGFLFLIAYILPKLKFSNKFLLYTMFPLFILTIAGITDKILLSILETSLGLFGIGSKMASYVSAGLNSRGINPLNYLEIAPFLYFAIKYRTQMHESKQGRFFFNMFIFYIYFMITTMHFMSLTRISSYYIYSFFFIISYAFDKIKIYNNRVIYGYAFSIYFMLYGIRFILSNFSSYGYHIFFLNT